MYSSEQMSRHGSTMFENVPPREHADERIRAGMPEADSRADQAGTTPRCVRSAAARRYAKGEE
jgi:hypothetical protein